MTKSEIKSMLKVYCILIVDYREQTNSIENFFSAPEKNERKARKNVIRMPLTAGDYTFMIMGNEFLGNTKPISFENQFLIEKKSGEMWSGGGFQEMKSNLTTGHDLFKKEFQYPVKNLYLLLENSESDKSLFLCKRGRTDNKVYYKIFNSFIEKRNLERSEKSLNPIEIVYCPAHKSGIKVKELIFNFVLQNIESIKNL